MVTKDNEEGWLGQEELEIGGIYVAHYKGGNSLYLLIAADRQLSKCHFINESRFIRDGNFAGSFQGKIFKKASIIEELTLKKSIEANEYSPVFAGEYKLTTSSGEYYTAALELDNKIEWTEECKDIVKYIKDDKPIFLFGGASKKPKTFKELKEIIWQEKQ